MEFVDEEARQRFLLRPGAPSPKPNSLNFDKIHCFICVLISILVLFASIFVFQSQTISFFCVWIALSVFIGSFAPESVTGGNIRVGEGRILEVPVQNPVELDVSKRFGAKHRSRFTKPEAFQPSNPPPIVEPEVNSENVQMAEAVNVSQEVEYKSGREQERGNKPHESNMGVSSSVLVEKAMENDSFAPYPKERKQVDRRTEDIHEMPTANPKENGRLEDLEESNHFSAMQDLALLSALKSFPKDTALRWEKVAAAVPGQSKASCMKRFAELKRNFRNSKASQVSGEG